MARHIIQLPQRKTHEYSPKNDAKFKNDVIFPRSTHQNHAKPKLFAPNIVPESTRLRPSYRIVGIENCAPSLIPLGQRAVTVLVLV